MTEKQIKRAILKKVDECIDIAKKHYGMANVGNCFSPEVTFDLRGVAAGKCLSYQDIMNFTLQFHLEMAKQNFEDFINNTVPHEVAHMVDCVIHKGYRTGPSGRRKFHDKTFKTICKVLGGSGDTCHNYTVNSTTAPRRMPRNHVYVCGCREHHLTKILHTRIKNGQNRTCRSCKTRIKYSHTNPA